MKKYFIIAIEGKDDEAVCNTLDVMLDALNRTGEREHVGDDFTEISELDYELVKS
jgi:hypothetical protein